MPVVPSSNEEEYFAREEAEKRRRAAKERQEALALDERERARTLHFMRCPKCGSQLEEIAFGGVQLDKCFNCEGLWLDAGELESVLKKESGFMRRMFGAFRP